MLFRSEEILATLAHVNRVAVETAEGVDAVATDQTVSDAVEINCVRVWRDRTGKRAVVHDARAELDVDTSCLGGYYQAEYLPRMQAGLIRALSAAPADREMAEAVAGVPTDRYLSGMQTVMIAREGGLLLPAGPLEMMARQGLTDLDTERMLSMTMEDAHLASLFETIPDIAPGEAAAAAWKERISRDAFDALRERVVVK